MHTVPPILTAAVKALHAFMQLVRQWTNEQPTSSSADSRSISTSFASANLHATLRAYHLCHLIESFILLPPPPTLLLPTVRSCAAVLQTVHEASLETRVYELAPLVCAYVWRVRSVVDGVSAAEEANTVFEYVRRERRKQREADVKAENDALL